MLSARLKLCVQIKPNFNPTCHPSPHVAFSVSRDYSVSSTQLLPHFDSIDIEISPSQQLENKITFWNELTLPIYSNQSITGLTNTCVHACFFSTTPSIPRTSDDDKSVMTIAQKQIDAIIWHVNSTIIAISETSSIHPIKTIELFSENNKFSILIDLERSHFLLENDSSTFNSLLFLFKENDLISEARKKQKYYKKVVESISNYISSSYEIAIQRLWNEKIHSPSSMNCSLWLAQHLRAKTGFVTFDRFGHRVPASVIFYADKIHAFQTQLLPVYYWNTLAEFADLQFPKTNTFELVSAIERFCFLLRFTSSTSRYALDIVDICERNLNTVDSKATLKNAQQLWKELGRTFVEVQPNVLSKNQVIDSISDVATSDLVELSRHHSSFKYRPPITFQGSHSSNDPTFPKPNFSLITEVDNFQAKKPTQYIMEYIDVREEQELLSKTWNMQSYIRKIEQYERKTLVAAVELHNRNKVKFRDDDRYDNPTNVNNVNLLSEDCDSLQRWTSFMFWKLQQQAKTLDKKNLSSTANQCAEISLLYSLPQLICTTCSGASHVDFDDAESDHEDEFEILACETHRDRICYWNNLNKRRINLDKSEKRQVFESEICHICNIGIPKLQEELWAIRGMKLLKLLENKSKESISKYCSELLNNKEWESDFDISEYKDLSKEKLQEFIFSLPTFVLESTEFTNVRQDKDEEDRLQELEELLREDFEFQALFITLLPKKKTLTANQKRGWNVYHHGIVINSVNLLEKYNEALWYIVDLNKSYKELSPYPRVCVDVKDIMDNKLRNRFVLVPANSNALKQGEEKRTELQESFLFMSQFQPLPRVHEMIDKTDTLNLKRTRQKDSLIIYVRPTDWRVSKSSFENWCKKNRLRFIVDEMNLYKFPIGEPHRFVIELFYS